VQGESVNTCFLKTFQMERETTKGGGWFNMPVAEMTDEKKNDLMVIQMRKVLNPKRFYKGPDIRGALPKYVQVHQCITSDNNWSYRN